MRIMGPYRHGELRVALGLLCACWLCASSPVHALESVSEWNTWTDPGVAGWTGGTTQVTLSNPGSWLNLAFKSQAMPSLVAVTVYRPVSEIWLTNLIFRLKADEIPSAVRVYFHTARNGNLWYLIVNRPQATGQWMEVSAPVNFDDGWTMGPIRNKQQFESDRRTIDWVGVYVRRSASGKAHNVAIDDFGIQGLRIPTAVPIAGQVTYGGEQADGPVYIAVTPVEGGPGGSGNAPGLGGFLLTNAPPVIDCRATAYCDSNTNSVQDIWEPYGTGIPNPFDTGMTGYVGVQVTLQDPRDSGGLPLWWILDNFGPLDPDGVEGGVFTNGASADNDFDGTDNYAEYVLGTDPATPNPPFVMDAFGTNPVPEVENIVLEWPSVAGRTYNVWRTTNLMVPFERYVSNLPATPPVNRLEDTDTDVDTPYFYRVEVRY